MGFNPYYPRTWRKDKDSDSEILDKSHRSHMTGKRKIPGKLRYGHFKGIWGVIWGFWPNVIVNLYSINSKSVLLGINSARNDTKEW